MNNGNITLSIDLQEGFVDDTVIVRINNKEIFQKEHLTTNKLLGISASFKTEVVRGMSNIEIKILNRRIEKIISIDVSAPIFLGISVQKDKVDYVISAEPFGYA